MGAALSLEAQAQPTACERLLKELAGGAVGAGRRADASAQPGAHVRSAAILKRQLAARLKLVTAQIGDIDKVIAKVMSSDAVTARRHDILCSIPGLGAVAAAAVAILLPEIGKLDRKQVASLAGLAPMTRSSGQWSGRSFITGGRQDMRIALYMPAIAAMRRNPDLRAKYEALRAAGKPAVNAGTNFPRSAATMPHFGGAGDWPGSVIGSSIFDFRRPPPAPGWQRR
ncbi:transposase [Cereibacter azotoformans]|uniref:transposase n=1 Tax=Cereibacter azotoformans TaxID=43057 RepID=UPI003B8A7E3B